MGYIDGFVLPVPRENREKYREQATRFAEMFKEYGAISVIECWGDDLPKGKSTDFWMAVKAEESESVVFSWVLWPSKEARDAGNKKMMKDERCKDAEMPFDGKRMIVGGFEVFVDV